MAKVQFPKFRSFLMFAAMISAAILFRFLFYSEEVIQIDGKLAEVTDGDSFRIGKDEFRIYGVDAPEYRQICQDEAGSDWPCGRAARNGLDGILRSGSYNCTTRARDRFGRAIVQCISETGEDLGAALVVSGLAVSGHDFDEVIHAKDEQIARKAKRGLWRGDFVRPDIWRNQNPRD